MRRAYRILGQSVYAAFPLILSLGSSAVWVVAFIIANPFRPLPYFCNGTVDSLCWISVFFAPYILTLAVIHISSVATQLRVLAQDRPKHC